MQDGNTENPLRMYSPVKITDPVPHHIEKRIDGVWVFQEELRSHTQAVTRLRELQSPHNRIDWRIVRVGNVVIQGTTLDASPDVETSRNKEETC